MQTLNPERSGGGARRVRAAEGDDARAAGRGAADAGHAARGGGEGAGAAALCGATSREDARQLGGATLALIFCRLLTST